MQKQRELSDPITMRMPLEVLSSIEEIAATCNRSRSWVFVRALKAYLAAEGKEILDIASARRELVSSDGIDIDDLIGEIETDLKDAAA
jgi:hypothetical protein